VSEISMQGEEKMLASRQLDMVYKRFKLSFFSSLVISLLLVAALWPVVTQSTLLAWLASIWLVTSLRNVDARHYLHLGHGASIALDKWRIRFVIGSAAAGVCWGITVFLFSASPNDNVDLLLIFVIAGVTAFASASMSAVPSAIIAFLLSSLLPLAVWLFSFGERLHYFMGAIVLIYLGLMLIFSRQMHNMIRILLSTTAQNKELGNTLLENEGMLHLSEQKFRSLVENLPDNITRWDVEGRYLHVNPVHERTLGITSTDLIGKRIGDLFPDTHAEVKAAISKVVATGQAVLFVRQPVSVNGEAQIHDVSLVPERDADGKVIAVLGIGRNMTDSYRLQERLAASEREYRALAENTPDPIYRYDCDCRRIYVNSAVGKITGKSVEELIGGTPGDGAILVSEQNRRLMEAIRGVFDGGEIDSIVLDFVGQDGEHHDYLMLLVPERDAGGQVATVLAIARDVTAIRSLERYQSQFFAVAPGFFYTSIWESNGQSSTPFASAGIRELFGLEPEEVKENSQLLHALIHPDDQEERLSKIEESARNLTRLHYECRISHPKYGVRWVEADSLPQRLPDGAVRWDGFMHDITKRKQAEIELKNNYERTIELNNLLESNARDLEDQAVELEAQATELEASRDMLMQTEAWYRGIVHSAPDGLLVINELGHISLVNRDLEKMFGYGKDELLGKPLEVLLPPTLREGHVSKREGFVAGCLGGRPMEGTLGGLRGCRKDGSEFSVDISLSRLPDIDGNAGIVCAAIRDITLQQNMRDELSMREQESRTLVENSPDNISRYNRECRRIYVNPVFARSVKGGKDALLGKTPSECPGGPNSEIYENKISEVFETGVDADFELNWFDKDGKEISSHVRLTAERDSSGEVISVLAVGRDITELNEHRTRIYHMAFYDSLTSLPNRALFHDRLRQMLTDVSWHEQLAGIMLLDLDRFKAVNDTLGHPAGDALLREAAGRLTNCVRAYDTVARLGGDEFAILFPEIRSAEDLGRIANKILEEFNKPFMLEGKEVFISTSVGIAVYPDDSSVADELIKQADSAMYFAKRSGRNNFRFYSTELTASASERLSLESELRRAIQRNELELYYQPKVRLTDGALIGSEALLRWNNPLRGMVSPDQFISIAEDSGLIVEIGEWVLRDACRVACEWNGPGKPLHKVAINLSARQFQSGDLVRTVTSILDETGCYPEWIELEITESLLLDEFGEVEEILKAFQSIGISIAIDDFGTGYSALSYLTRFPINTLKIDRSFISTITSDNFRAELVRAIISIAHTLNQHVVAEGVETREQAIMLRGLGCQAAQGYLYSKPIRKSAFELLPLTFVQEAEFE
jgi:diguanylate cyclase (GGDEF)-like protein/PAS domain S-box-containing protein